MHLRLPSVERNRREKSSKNVHYCTLFDAHLAIKLKLFHVTEVFVASTPIQFQNRSTQSGRVRDSQPTPIDRKILNNWKELAAYMGRGVLTVQRYERTDRLPIRRPAIPTGNSRAWSI
jgi:hypothetical protein